MLIEQAKVGPVAARLMERLEQDYETDESAEVSSVLLISAVRHDAGERLTVHYDTSSGVALHEGLAGWAFVGYLDHHGSEEVTEALRCRQCGENAS